MSYHIDYNPEMKNRYPNFIKVRREIPIRTIIVLIVVIVACYGFISGGILKYMIPGDPVVTTAAFSGMVDDIGAGESVRQALLNFCKEIIVNGH